MRLTVIVLSVLRTKQFLLGFLLVSIIASIFLSIQSMGNQLSSHASNAAAFLLQGSSDSKAFTTIVSSSAASLIDIWSYLGLVSVIVSSTVWAWWVVDSKDREAVLFSEQGATNNQIVLSYSLAATIATAFLFFLSLAFSLFEQSLATGAVDFSLGGTPIYSSVGAWEIALEYAIAALISVFAVFFLGNIKKNDSPKMRNARPLGISTLNRKLAVLCIAVVIVAFSSSLAFESTISYAQDLGYYYSPQGTVLLPSGPLYLSTTFALPANLTSCTSYSAEVAFPSKVGGFNTVMRGVDESNASRFLGLDIASGYWPSRTGEIALGSSLAQKLGAKTGSVLNVTDLLRGNESLFTVSGVYRSVYQVTSEEIITDLQNARSLDGLSDVYSYVRTLGCELSARSSSLGIPQVAARVFSNSSNAPPSSAFAGAQPLLDSLAAIISVIVLGSAMSLFLATDIYLKSFTRVARVLFEQGVPIAKPRIAVAKGVVPVLIISALVGVALAGIIASILGLGGMFHYALILPSGWYLLVFVLVVSVLPILSVATFGYSNLRDN